MINNALQALNKIDANFIRRLNEAGKDNRLGSVFERRFGSDQDQIASLSIVSLVKQQQKARLEIDNLLFQRTVDTIV